MYTREDNGNVITGPSHLLTECVNNFQTGLEEISITCTRGRGVSGRDADPLADTDFRLGFLFAIAADNLQLASYIETAPGIERP